MLGRAADLGCNLVLDHPSASRVHALIGALRPLCSSGSTVLDCACVRAAYDDKEGRWYAVDQVLAVLCGLQCCVPCTALPLGGALRAVCFS